MGVMHVQLCTSYCFVRTRGLITIFLTHSYPFLIPDGSFPTKLIVDYPHYLIFQSAKFRDHGELGKTKQLKHGVKMALYVYL